MNIFEIIFKKIIIFNLKISKKKDSPWSRTCRIVSLHSGHCSEESKLAGSLLLNSAELANL